MLNIKLDRAIPAPLYKQIVEQIRGLIAAGQLNPGEHLPTVRQLADFLQVNPNTVARAYMELEQEQVLASRHGGGTTVTAKADDPAINRMHQRRLSEMVSNSILHALSMGYSPEEIGAAFHLNLSRWQEERKDVTEMSTTAETASTPPNTITIVGSHDMALNLLVDQLRQTHPEINVQVNHAGSLGGLIALQEERADLAGVHLLDEETGEYNYPYIKRVLPGRKVAIVHLAYRIQGLIFARNNPKQIKGFEDLKRRDITLINRQKGSGTRLLLDLRLRELGISPSDVYGYEIEVDTHTAIASAIANGKADLGLGIEAAARAYGLDFLPVSREKYDLVIPIAKYSSKLISPLLAIINSDDFKKTVVNVSGYDTSQTGAVSFCN